MYPGTLTYGGAIPTIKGQMTGQWSAKVEGDPSDDSTHTN